MMKNHIFFTLFSAAVIAAGCSHTPSLGEQMINQGDGTEKMGEHWIDGDKMSKKGQKKIHDGEAKIKKGEKLIRQGKADIHKGHAMVSKGHKLQNKVEKQFHEKFPEIELENS